MKHDQIQSKISASGCVYYVPTEKGYMCLIASREQAREFDVHSVLICDENETAKFSLWGNEKANQYVLEKALSFGFVKIGSSAFSERTSQGTMPERKPKAYLMVEDKSDGTFVHTFISDQTGEVVVSTRCIAKDCNCAGCKIVAAYYGTENGPVKIIEGNDWRTVDEKRIIHAIYTDIELLIRFVERDPALVHEFTPGTFESPIEKLFYELAQYELNLYAQHSVGPYRLDFAIPEKLIAIELDGHDYHKTKEQRTHDAKRDRYLAELGWTVLRFTGTEIYRDPKSCVDQICRIVDIRAV